MPPKPKKSVAQKRNEDLHLFWKVIVNIFSTLGKIISKVLEVVYIFFSMLFQVLKTFFFGISSIIAASALMIIAISLTAWFVSSAIGLPDSETFQTERDKVVAELFEEWEDHRQTEKQKKAARKDDLRIEEITDLSCQLDTQCRTPAEYLSRSSCAFESRCLENECVIVCPQ